MQCRAPGALVGRVDRDNSATSAAGEPLIGFHIEDQHPVPALPDGDDMNAVDAEDLIGPSAPGRTGQLRSS